MTALAFLFVLMTQTGVNPDSALVAQFQNNVADYVKATAKIKANLPALKPTDSRETITQRDADLCRQIQQLRTGTAQGNFFPQPIAAEFRRLIGIALQGRGERRILKSLEHAEPVEGQLKVNDPYPNVPLQSMPTSLLANLPALPPGVDYRIVGRSLVLRDVQANLVLDFIPKAIP
jgi:hypothetical protein